jgi:hypothetical protein
LLLQLFYLDPQLPYGVAMLKPLVVSGFVEKQAITAVPGV